MGQAGLHGGLGRSTASSGARFEQDPLIAVISPYMFGVSADVTAGQAMQRVLLTATTEGLAASFLSQVVEVEQTRDQLRRLIGAGHSPRVVLRIGRGWPVPATPRRAGRPADARPGRERRTFRRLNCPGREGLPSLEWGG